MKQKTALFTIILMALVFGVGVAWAQSAQAEFETGDVANQLYENGRYAEATQAYEQLIAQGLANSAVYYNLGNAYMQQGEIGRAILNYKRAQALAPRDADIAANLALARAQTVDRFDGGVPDDLVGIFNTAVQANLTFNQLALLALGLWFALGMGIIVYRQMRGGRGKTAVALALFLTGILFVVSAFSLGSRIYEANTFPPAVIVAEQVDVTNGPGEQYTVQFTLHDGAEIGLLETRGQWAKLALPGGETTGWVPASAVEPVERDA